MDENIDMVVLTGAGISAESGLGTFRDKDGIWTKYPLEDLATPEGFARNPDFVHDFYNTRRRQLETAKPNAAHTALARLQSGLAGRGVTCLIVTQNIDNLHEQGGSVPSSIIHMHGELTVSRCGVCEQTFECRDDLSTDMPCPACAATGGMRPHVVWFGEMPLEMDRIERAVAQCTSFVSIGTSGDVYPAAGFVHMAAACGAHTVELNLEPSANADQFSEGHYGLASDVVPAWVDRILA